MAKNSKRRQHFISFNEDVSDEGDHEPKFEVWATGIPASVKHVTGGESFRGSQIEANTTIAFNIEYMPGCNERMQIEHEGNDYEINKIDDPGDLHRELVIHANAVNRNG